MTILFTRARVMAALLAVAALGWAAPGSAAAAPAADLARCSSSQLLLHAVPDPAGSGMNHFADRIVFINMARTTCTMYGYPGVSYVTGPSGWQVNDPATRAGGIDLTLVKVPPNGSTSAMLYQSRTDPYDPNTCQPMWVAGLRVYPPDEYDALYVSNPTQVCSVNGVAVPVIYPVGWS